MSEPEYILGTDRVELERLRSQHLAWAEPMAAILRSAGFGLGDRLLDLGSGPGYTTLDLAALVGERGRVIACDESAGFLAFLEAECERLGVTHVETREGAVEALELEPESLDGAYARWLFCWLEDPVGVLANVVRALRPGGAVAIQDYLDWGVLRILPVHPAVDRAVETCMRSWALGGGEIDVERVLLASAPELGLRVESLEPVARIGAVGSPEWRWIGGFFESYLPRLVERGLLTSEEHEACRAAWRACEAAGYGFVSTPTVGNLVLRKPG